MLILTRRIGESLIIAQKIKITVLGFIQGEQVRIKVTAPKDATANHQKLHEKINKTLGETLSIQKNIHLTFISIKGRQVRIGVTAPKYIAVDREEIHLRKQQGIAPPKGNLKQPAAYRY